MEDVPQNLADMSIFALEHGVESIAAGGPLVPFVAIDRGGELALHRFVAETLEECVAQARAFLRSELPSCDRCAVVWDGFLTIEGGRSDALFAHGFERGAESGPIFAPRYKRVGLRRRNKAFGDPVLCEIASLG